MMARGASGGAVQVMTQRALKSGHDGTSTAPQPQKGSTPNDRVEVLGVGEATKASATLKALLSFVLEIFSVGGPWRNL